MDLHEVVTAFRARWWILVAGLLVGALAALGFSLLATPRYSAHTQLFVSTTRGNSANDVFEGGQFSQARVASYAPILAGENLAGRVVRRLNLPVSPAELAREIDVVPVKNTVLLNVTVTDSSPQRALQIADAIVPEFTALVGQLEATKPGAASPVRVSVTERPGLPGAPVWPQIPLTIALAALLGLFIGAVVAVVRERLDHSVRDAGDAADLVGARVVGVIPRDKQISARPAIDRSNSSPAVEAFRRVKFNVSLLDGVDGPRTILVTSASWGEGRTTTAANLALAFAESRHRVALLETDFRRPHLASYFGLQEGIGLADALAGRLAPEEAVQSYGAGRLSVVAAGPVPPNPGELLTSTQLPSILEKFRSENDLVIMLGPPVLPVADCSGLVSMADGVLLVVRYGGATREQLTASADLLEQARARMLGVVLNMVPAKHLSAAAMPGPVPERRL
jgi:capsular exopolysaccharide synthesis family protein